MGVEWMVEKRKSLKLPDASSWPTKIREIILLYIQLAHLKVRTWFFVCPNVVVEGILGASFVDRCIKAI